MQINLKFPMDVSVTVHSIQHLAELEKFVNKIARESQPPAAPLAPKVDPVGSLNEPPVPVTYVPGQPLPEALRIAPPNHPPRKGKSADQDPVGPYLIELIEQVYVNRTRKEQPSMAELGRFMAVGADANPSTAWRAMGQAQKVTYERLLAIAKATRIPVDEFEKRIDLEKHIRGEIPQARFKIANAEATAAH